MSKSVERRLSYQLKSLDRSAWDLIGYVFSDEEHAQKWMAQKFVPGSSFYAVPVRVRTETVTCSCGDSHLHSQVTRDRSGPTPAGEKTKT